MADINFFQKLALSFIAFFAVLFNRSFAVAVFKLRHPELSGATGAKEDEIDTKVEIASSAGDHLPVARPDHADRRDALHLLSVLQRDGRLIDFLQEDIASYSDSEVGAAARAVHGGCSGALKNYFALEPVMVEPEGASIVVAQGFDPASVRLTGNVIGSPPFRGSLKHHGWRAKEVKMPSAPQGQDPAIIAPAEVELP